MNPKVSGDDFSAGFPEGSTGVAVAGFGTAAREAMAMKERRVCMGKRDGAGKNFEGSQRGTGWNGMIFQLLYALGGGKRGSREKGVRQHFVRVSVASPPSAGPFLLQAR